MLKMSKNNGAALLIMLGLSFSGNIMASANEGVTNTAAVTEIKTDSAKPKK